MQEEISLRELIEILLKGKKIIIGCTIFAIILAAIVTFFIISPIYEAVSVLSIQSIAYETYSGNTNSTNIFLNDDNLDWKAFSQIYAENIQDSRFLISSLIKYPSMTEEAYKNKLTSHEILNKVKLEVPSIKNSSIESLRSKINITSKDGLFTIKVKDPDPQTAANIANLLVEKFITYMDKYNSEYIDNLNRYIASAIEKQEKDMEVLVAEVEKSELSKDNNKFEQLHIKYDVSKQIYEVLLFKQEQLKLIQMKDFDDKNVSLIRKAYEPKNPISPNKKLNLTIAAVLGLMIGVFAAFFREYWQTSSKGMKKINVSPE